MLPKGVMYGEVVDDLVPWWLKDFKTRPSYRVVKGVIRTLISFLVILCARSISEEAMEFINKTVNQGEKNTMLHLFVVLAIAYNSSEDLRIMMIVGIIYLILQLTILRNAPTSTKTEETKPLSTTTSQPNADHIAANHMINDNNEYWDSH